MRTATADPKATLLGVHPGRKPRGLDAWGTLALQESQASQRFYATNWKSTYQSEFCDFSKQQAIARSAWQPRPHTSLGLCTDR
jgi:hypothetical protein